MSNIDVRLAGVEDSVNKLIDKLFPLLLDRIEKIEVSVDELKAESPAKAFESRRKPLTYPLYVQIMKEADDGINPTELSKHYGIPYSTIKSYLNINADRLAKLKKEYEETIERVKTRAMRDHEQASQAMCYEIINGSGESWFAWGSELCDAARNWKDEDGFPNYYPCKRNQLVNVKYNNNTIDWGKPAIDIDWADGGVTAWCPAKR